MILAMLTVAFAFYDWVEWSSHPLVALDNLALMRVVLLRLAGALPIATSIAICLSVLSQRGVLLLPSVMTLVNMALLLLPFLCNIMAIWLAPDRNREYMLCLALFHAFFGYTTMAVPLVLLVPIQLPFSIGFIFAEFGSLDFNPEMRWKNALTQVHLLNASSVLPTWDEHEEVQAAAKEAGLLLEVEANTQYYTAAVYLFAAHLLGVLHNRKLRANLFNHANLLFEHTENMEVISEEVVNCQRLLENIFPQEVLERLKLRNDAATSGADQGPHSKVLAEEYTGCTFLFAKIVGLKQLTEDESRDPADVINVLQLIFDQFDLLADTFKIQKVRKTVNEYYMTAAGLPDPLLIEGPHERAKATAALAFAMVHIMDIINLELRQQQIDVTLKVQIGINTGSAIAGVIGHKRFQYDLCGDAVNTAARMCAKSAPGCITCSHATSEMLGLDYETLYRGEVAVKGKGSMRLYYLVGRTNETLQEERRRAALKNLMSGGRGHARLSPLLS
jgi:class 3 adenylate cyclase